MHEEKDYISFILDLRVPDTYYSSSMTHILVLIITDPQAITSSSFDIGSLLLHGLQHTRLPCPSPTSRAYSNSCPLSRWCHPTISFSVIPFSCLQSFPASGSFLMSQFFASGGQSIGASASVLPTNIQDWFPLGWTGSRLDLLAAQGTHIIITLLNLLSAFSFLGSDSKASAYNAGDLGLIPGSGRCPGKGNSNPFQYSCLENPMDGGAWWDTVHGVSKSRTRLSNFTFTFFHFSFLSAPWHHRLNGHDVEQAPGVGDGQGSLACCSPWGRKKSDMTERLNWTNQFFGIKVTFFHFLSPMRLVQSLVLEKSSNPRLGMRWCSHRSPGSYNKDAIMGWCSRKNPSFRSHASTLRGIKQDGPSMW